MTTLTDNFNRANQTNLGTSAGGWSWSNGDLEAGQGLVTVDIVSNRAQASGTGSTNVVRAESDLASNDNYAQAKITTWEPALGQGVCCRMASGSTPKYYMAYLLHTGGIDVVQLYYCSGGANFTQLGSNATVTVSLPNTLKVQAVGTTIKVFFDGVEKISVTDSSLATGVRSGLRSGGYTSTVNSFDDFQSGDVVGSITVSPAAIPKNHTGNITLTLTGSGTTWDGTTVFTPSGVTGTTKVSQNVTSSTAATLVVSVDSTHTGTLTVTESVTGSATGTTTVATATLSVSASSGQALTTPTVTLTGTNTIWNLETAAGLFSVSGGTGASIATPTVGSATSATAVLTVGSAPGTLTITDNSTGATTTFTVTRLAASVYFAASGNDSTGDGSSGNPFQTLAKIASYGIAGDSIYLNCGDTFSGELDWLDKGGNSGAQTTFASYGAGAKPLITPASNQWGIHVRNSSYLTFSGLDIKGTGVNGVTGKMTDASKNRLAGVFIENSATDGTAMSHITFDSCVIREHYIWYCQYSTGASNPGAINNVTLSNNTFDKCLAYGVMMHGARQNVGQTSGSPLWSPNVPRNVTWNIYGNAFTHVYGGNEVSFTVSYNGRTLTGGNDPAGFPCANDSDNGGPGALLLFTCDGFNVYNNYCNQGNAFGDAGAGYNIHNSSSGYVYNNEVCFCKSYGSYDGDGIDIESCQGVDVYNNYVHDNDGAGIFFFQNSGSFTYTNNTLRAFNNACAHNSLAHNYGEIYVSGGAQSSIQVFSNTLYSQLANNNVLAWDATAGTGNLIIDNQLLSSAGGNLLNVSVVSGITVSGNNYYKSAGTFNIHWVSTNYSTLAAWKTASSQDAAGRNQNPSLANPGNAGTLATGMATLGRQLLAFYGLQAGSPEIDQGVSLAGAGITAPANDMTGRARIVGAAIDAGAFEYTAAGFGGAGYLRMNIGIGIGI